MAEDRDIIISAAAAKRLLRLGDGRALLYYLHILSGGGVSAESTAQAFGWSEAETLAAQAALSAAGVLPRPAPEDIAEAGKPSYSASDITDKIEGDPAFATLITYAQSRMNRLLSPSDTEKLLNIYDHLGMPAGEIMLLVSFCVSREKANRGEAARVSMLTVEREAYRWMREGIDSEDKAEHYVRGLEARDRSVERLKGLLQIRGRDLTVSERKYLEKWAASGLPDEAIYAAYDKTVLATGALKWAYMDRIIEDWKQNGVPDDTAQKKPAPSTRHPATRKAQQDAPMSAAELQRRRREQKKEDDDR